MKFKGIILAGGAGTRLYPITKIISKQLLPIYDKPMIYYPLSVLMLAGINDVLIISTSEDIPRYKKLFENSDELGLKISYAVQKKPNGIAEAFIIGADFIGTDGVVLILGDNIFYGQGFSDILKNAVSRKDGATIFSYYVNDPERFGVVDFDGSQKVISIEEKPKNPKSNYAVTGLYFYDNKVINIAKNLKLSPRGELEITDVNVEYFKKNKLYVEVLGRGFAWLDTGTHDSFVDASLYIKTIEDRQGLKIGCVEEIAYRLKYINRNQLTILAKSLSKNHYGEYLFNLLK